MDPTVPLFLATMDSYRGPVFDQSEHFPVVGRADAALRANDWNTFVEVFASANQQERHSMVRRGGSVKGREDFFRSILQAHPGDVLASTMLADRYVTMAWEARGPGNFNSVTPEGYKAFLEYLRTAEQILIGVCAQQPQFTQAWAVRLFTATGLDLGTSEMMRRYERLSSHSPHDLHAQFITLQDLLPKWGGTWGMGHDFVWKCANAAPPGASNACLVVMYYVERLISDDVSRVDEVLREPQVRQEIMAAAQRSVMSSAFTTGTDGVTALSLFALVFSMLEDWPSAKSCFTRLGPFAEDAGWEYFGKDPATIFREARQEAMSKG
jgi:hypothetical protein